MSSPPPLEPTIATPQAQLKRKRDSVDIAVAVRKHAPAVVATSNGQDALEDREEDQKEEPSDDEGDDLSDGDDEDEDDELDEEILEAALDEIELNPYVPEQGDEAISPEAAKALWARLRAVGVEKFLSETTHIPPRQLGSAFGMDPNLAIDDDLFLHILGFAIVRAYRKRQKLVAFNTIDDVANLLQTRQNIMVITGAGISTSLGIPDFRSKSTGFYDRVRQLGYADGEDVFNIENFDYDPQMFYSLAGDILPPDGDARFSPTHAFIRLLQDKGRLQTNYTQNIDNLEARAGIDPEKLIQCHGSFATASCRKCRHRVPGRDIFVKIRAQEIAYCTACEEELADQAAQTKKKPKPKKRSEFDDDDDTDDEIPTAGVMKPDITFFGEALPSTFFERFTERDAQAVDLVIVIGTSLKVAPVSEMPHYLPAGVPHVYISREPIEHVNFDVQLLGDCDVVVAELCKRAGWDLRHEMIPDEATEEGKREVFGVGDSGCRWSVKSGLQTGENTEIATEGLPTPAATGEGKVKSGLKEVGDSQDDATNSGNDLLMGNVTV